MKCPSCSRFMEERSTRQYKVVYKCNSCGLSLPDRDTKTKIRMRKDSHDYNIGKGY